MRLLIILLAALSSCAMQSGQYARTGSANDPNIPSGRVFEKEFLKRVNAIRTSGCKCGKTYMPPVAPLKWDTKLEMAAIDHARDMYRNNYLTHTNSKGHTIKQRIEAAGYKLKGTYSYGENIASGQRSIDRVIQGWLQSEGHCKNLMNPAFKDIGAAQFNYYWVQDFAMHMSSGTDLSSSSVR